MNCIFVARELGPLESLNHGSTCSVSSMALGTYIVCNVYTLFSWALWVCVLHRKTLFSFYQTTWLTKEGLKLGSLAFSFWAFSDKASHFSLSKADPLMCIHFKRNEFSCLVQTNTFSKPSFPKVAIWYGRFNCNRKHVIQLR